MVAICLHNFGFAQDGWIDDAPFIHEEEEEEDEDLHVDNENEDRNRKKGDKSQKT